jgi:hypothetical protein
VIQLSGTVISLCWSYVEGMKNAPKDIRAIIKELQSLSHVLEHLERLAEGEGTPGSSRLLTLEKICTPDGQLAECMKELRDLEAKLKLPTGWKEQKKALIWPMREGTVRKTLDSLERAKAALSLALTVDQTCVISEQRDHRINCLCRTVALVTQDCVMQIRQGMHSTMGGDKSCISLTGDSSQMNITRRSISGSLHLTPPQTTMVLERSGNH